MNSSNLPKAMLISLWAGVLVALGCGSSPEGKYRDPSDTINAQFKDGKAYIGLGAYAVTGTYKIEGKKIIATADFGMMIPNPCVFTINDDGSIDGPKDSMIPRLEKAE